MKITFLGTGTSMGVPIIGCNCEVCRSDDPRDKRLRTSVLIHHRGKNIVIDTGSDFRQQALRANIATLDAILFTHHHVDHVFGLDEIRPINYLRQKTVSVFLSQDTLDYLKKIYSYIFARPQHYKDLPRIQWQVLNGSPFIIDDIPVTPIPLLHGCLPILGYRIGNFAYCTDVSEIPAESYPLLAGLEVLVLGALRYRPHPTHFTIEQAVEEAQKIAARKTYLVHMSHEVSHQKLSGSLPDTIQPAYDGLVVTVGEEIRK
ncbi:MAG TPA: MBL fold metallo-hydrolase [Caldithrix sp.]|nr:MBL fold metallo-hydrolase [Caldithrix sp.]